MSIKKASRTTTTRTDRETSLSIEEMKENISSIREIINDRVLNNNLLTDTHGSPDEDFNELIKDKYFLQGSWFLIARGIDVPSSFQPKKEEDVDEGFDVRKYYTYNVSPMIIKQDSGEYNESDRTYGDSRFFLCLALPDIMDAIFGGVAPEGEPANFGSVSYGRRGLGYQPGYLDNTDPSGACLTIRDYEDNGSYMFRLFKRDSDGIINEMHGTYVESGYNRLNPYQAPRIMAVECWKMSNSTNYKEFPPIFPPIVFPDTNTKATTIQYKDEDYSEETPIINENDIQFWKQDYYYDFTPIDSNQWIKQTTFPVQNKDGKINGIGYGLYKYSMEVGKTMCLNEDRFAMFDKTYEYDNTRNYSKDRFTIPDDAIVTEKLVTSAYNFSPNYNDEHVVENYDVKVYRLNDEDVTIEDLQSKEFITVYSATDVPVVYKTVVDNVNKSFKVEKVEQDNVGYNTSKKSYNISDRSKTNVESKASGGVWMKIIEYFEENT